MSDAGDRSSRRSSRAAASRPHSPPRSPPIEVAGSSSRTPEFLERHNNDAQIVGHPPSTPSPIAIAAAYSPSCRLRQPQDQSSAAPNLSVDLREVEYVSNVDDNLVCLICHCPFVEPRILSCDHAFCKECLVQAFAVQRPTHTTCPTCRTPAKLEDCSQKVHRMTERMLDELVIKCPNSYLGCGWAEKRVDVQDHIELYCSYTMLACPDRDCKLQILAKDFHRGCLHGTDHMKKSCENRMTTCNECQKELVRVDLPSHLAESCPKAIIPCTGEPIGCDFKAERVDVLKHTPDCPMVKMYPHFAAQNAKIEEQGKAQKLMNRKINILEGSMSALQDMLTPGNVPSSLSDMNDLTGAPFDSGIHHVLSVNETLREEVDRTTSALAELDGRLTMTVLNEQSRTRDELLHINHAIGSMRVQLQWLISARIQAQGRVSGSSVPSASGPSGSASAGSSSGVNLQPVRRLSDPNRQDPKL
ncbi:hypothetical protein EJ05DRAFT_535202 [Pseudovirgaria hyperparasitica]|uniref:TRAF-type zinc finger protein n=1 Tax=Pseudovirgaria hyperparasitica TaxID=470096 RepID=A0A6A6WJX7_9PEZI|nr:uncharacterized protein EJ05DRAFT_535202 [Pseudovirgaria hyperparasitica]KAF2761881.1 hypothetical protein EJ05DRAFT_535202 [Pseudovirgaria hyperparasitica]